MTAAESAAGRAGGSDAWSAKVVLVSFALLIAIMTPIILLNFPILKRSTIQVTPERYLYASVYSLIGAIITGLILTRAYTDVDYTDTLLIDWYGYNNVCIYFDFFPARYVICIYIWFIGFFGVNYCLADIKRLKTLDYLSPRVKIIATNVDRLFMIICCSLPIWTCVVPEDNMRMHTAPFLCLILGMPMIFISRLFVLPTRASCGTVATIIAFSILSGVKASFTIGALATKHHVPPTLGQSVDVLWTLFALAQPFLVPPIPVLQYRENYWMAGDLLEDTTTIYNLLYIPLCIWIVFSLIFHCVVGSFQHFFAYFQSPSPDIQGATRRSGKVVPESDDPEPIQLAKTYVGTIYGFFDSLQGSKRFYHLKESLGSSVFATNDGTPVVMCLDYGSSEVLFKRSLEKGRDPIFRPQTMISSSGKAAIDHRRILLAVLPSSVTDPDYLRAFDDIREEFRRWDDTDIYLDMTIIELCRSVVYCFISSAIFGATLPIDLYRFATLTPLDLFLYPSFPQWLTPTHYQRKEAFRLILIQMKGSPKWPSIEKAMNDMEISEEDATFALVSTIAVNSSGLALALMQAILCLSPMSEMQQNELLSHTNLLESFCWECIRCQAPPLAHIVDEDTKIKTSSGRCHQVKKGTKLVAPLSIVARDPMIWKDPHIFKPDRYDQDESSEPVPSINFGCPLGTMMNKEQHNNTRQCAFLPLAVPTLKILIRILLQDCKWKLDRKSRMTMEKSKVHSPVSKYSLPELDFHPSRLCGGPNPLVENMLDGAEGAKFVKFMYQNPIQVASSRRLSEKTFVSPVAPTQSLNFCWTEQKNLPKLNSFSSPKEK